MKKIIKIAALLIASLLLFSSCEKADSPLDNKTWKMTVFLQDMEYGPDYDEYELKATKGLDLLRPGFNDIYFSISGRSVIVSMALPSVYNFYMPQFKDHFLILGTGLFTIEKTTETSGTIIFSGLELPWDDHRGETVFYYRDLTKKSVTFILAGRPQEEDEITYKLTVVSHPQFVTMAELESASPMS